jgi:hypothetical protein
VRDDLTSAVAAGADQPVRVCCVDPSKAAASSPRPAPDLLQALLVELGERGAKSITGLPFGGEFVVAAAEVLNEGMSGRDRAQ